MSQYNEGKLLTFEAAGDLSAKQYLIVKPGSGENDIAVASAASDELLGVLQNDPVQYQEAAVMIDGTTKVIAGGSISKGAMITTDSNGKAIATTTAGNKVIGIAIEDADANDVFEMAIVHKTIDG